MAGVDARNVKFHVELYSDTEKYADVESNSNVKSFLKEEKDGDLRFVDREKYLSRLYIGNNIILKSQWVPQQSDFQYGMLTSIVVIGDSEYISIYSTPEILYNYPKSGKRTLFSDLLNTKTTLKAVKKLESIVDEHGFTQEACDLIKAELEKEYTPAWVLPTAICGGVVVLAGVSAAITLIIRKKRRAAVVEASAE